jgi:hypothetical protein
MRDDVGWLMAGDTDRLRSPEAGAGLQAAEKRDEIDTESGFAKSEARESSQLFPAARLGL